LAEPGIALDRREPALHIVADVRERSSVRAVLFPFSKEEGGTLWS